MLFSPRIIEMIILWHSGEPMILPISFYEQAFQLVNKFNTRGVKVVHSIQTNDTLITQSWCDFIKQHHVQIGVSLDGPAHIHNLNRIDRAGNGTFERTMQGINLLQKNDIHPAILVVLTKYSLNFPDAIWQFLIEHNFTNLAFLPEEVLVANKQSTLKTEKELLLYKKFLRRILELRALCEVPPYIREINTLIERMELLASPAPSLDTVPAAFLSFDYKGNMSTFSSELLITSHPPYDNFAFGNIHQCNPDAIFSNQKFLEVYKQVQTGITRCQETCDYFALCGGGSPVHKLCENGDFASTETMYCKLKIKATTDILLDFLEDEYKATK
jgi:uncharacterized protein